jgi:hypothetical protein
MTSIAVAFDVSRLRQDLIREQRSLAQTVRRAVNAMAYGGRDAIKADMVRTFDRPTPWVLNSVNVIPATDSDVLAGTAGAVIDWKPGSAGTISGDKILRAQIEGGARRLKRFEVVIGLPANRVAVPGKWAELDRYGNISRGQITKLLSYLRLFGEQGYRANRSNRAGRGARQIEKYFMIPVGAEHATLAPGIYRNAQEMGGAPLLIIAFVRAANYRARFRPADIARAYVQSNTSTIWQQALTRTLPFRR